MQVTLSLKSWKVIQDEKTKLPKIAGRYLVMMGDKEVASQEFNEGYSAREIPFGPEVTQAVMAIEATIKAELERLLS